MARRGWDDEVDRRLVERAVAGHEQAFEVLLRRHHDRIYGIALRTTGDATAAEDIAQDVAIQLWRVLATFTGASRVQGLSYREAATVADVSEAALRGRLERGRRNLLAAMQEWA